MIATKRCCTATPLQLSWFMKGVNGNLRLHAGFISQFVVDPLPLQRLYYNGPTSRSSTNNDVVRETTVRALKIAYKVNQDLPVVTYNLPIASKDVFPPENSGREISRKIWHF